MLNEKNSLSQEELREICEDAFVNVKEACLRLQEKTKCSNKVVIDMLDSVADYYKLQTNENNE